MGLSFNERKKILKNANSLDLTPIKLYSEEILNDNLVTIIVPKFRNKIAVKYISPKLKSDHFNVKLDKFGSAVWIRINGKNKVGKIVLELKKIFGEELMQAEERISKFISQLYTQGFITFKELKERE